MLQWYLRDEQAFASVFVGTAAAETIIGSSADDFIDGGNGNDVLRGGAGNDYLLGGLGNDTYLFGNTAGHHTVNNYDPTVGRTDILRFDAGISPEEVIAERNGDNLILSITEDSSVTVLNYFSDAGSSAYKLEQIQFADGTVWQYQDTLSQLSVGSLSMTSSTDHQILQLIDALNAFDADSDAEFGGYVPARMSTEQYVTY